MSAFDVFYAIVITAFMVVGPVFTYRIHKRARRGGKWPHTEEDTRFLRRIGLLLAIFAPGFLALLVYFAVDRWDEKGSNHVGQVLVLVPWALLPMYGLWIWKTRLLSRPATT